MKKILILTACTTTLYLPLLTKVFAEEHGFLEDSKLAITAKNYYFDHNNRDNYAGQAREWGQGFIFDYKSGFTEGTVGFGIDAIGMFGFRLDSGGRAGKRGIDRNPGAVFPLKSNNKADNSFGSFGATPKIRISKTELKYGTFIPNLPVVVANNGRLLPQTFEGGMITSNEFNDFTFIAGKLEHAKGRAATNNESLSVTGAGRRIASNKFYFGGVDYRANKDLTLQYYYANLRNFYTQHFAGLKHNLDLPVGKLNTDLRYFYSDSDGKNASTAGRTEGYTISGYKSGYRNNNRGEVDNQTWSALFTYSVKGHALSAGYQSLSGNSILPSLNQGNAWGAAAAGSTAYVFTQSQISRFVNAGERTWLVGYAYDFKEIGVPGLVTSIKYLKGSQVRKANGDRTREWERDFKLAYKIQTGPLRDLEFAWQNATFRSGAANNADENRLIVTYTYIFDKF